MIIVTGGAGFIGSAAIWRLNAEGVDNVIVVDHLSSSEKWRNLVGLNISDYLDRAEFIDKLERGSFGNQIDAIIHMGACSSTTEADSNYLMENNYRYSVRVARYAVNSSKCRLIYASSAATYGDGSRGYSDNERELSCLRPLNMYGYSKHLFDLLAYREGWLSRIVGLKFFNVFGPNEQHKGDMRSVINKSYPDVKEKRGISLFKSYRADYEDGEQKRDFIYIKDAVDVIVHFINNRNFNGLYNVGTGRATSWNAVARAIFSAAEEPANINYIEMPQSLRDRYQYHTCADVAKLRSSGYSNEQYAIDAAVRDYVCNYLSKGLTLSNL